MRTTVTLDDELLAKAMQFTGIEEKSKLLNHALQDLINKELAARFLALEGTMPDLDYSQRSYRYERNPQASPILKESNE